MIFTLVVIFFLKNKFIKKEKKRLFKHSTEEVCLHLSLHLSQIILGIIQRDLLPIPILRQAPM